MNAQIQERFARLRVNIDAISQKFRDAEAFLGEYGFAAEAEFGDLRWDSARKKIVIYNGTRTGEAQDAAAACLEARTRGVAEIDGLLMAVAKETEHVLGLGDK